MKKILLTLLCAATVFNGMAQPERTYLGASFAASDETETSGKVYDNQLMVIVNDEISGPQDTEVSVVSNDDGTINFELKNFVLNSDGNEMGVGNIVLTNLATTTADDGYDHFAYEGDINITAGDKEGVDLWMGPMLSPIPAKLTGKRNAEKLYVTIDINLALLEQNIHVQLCYAKTYTEPLTVKINDEATDPQQADVLVVDNGDDTINFLLRNFILTADGQPMYIGNIYVEDIAVKADGNGRKQFSFENSIALRKGSLELPEGQEWLGPQLGQIPIKLQGEMDDDKLYVTIDINIGLTVFVQLGTIRGDVNGDKSVDIADVVSVLNIMAQGTYVSQADVNGDKSVDIADVVSVLNIMAKK